MNTLHAVHQPEADRVQPLSFTSPRFALAKAFAPGLPRKHGITKSLRPHCGQIVIVIDTKNKILVQDTRDSYPSLWALAELAEIERSRLLKTTPNKPS